MKVFVVGVDTTQSTIQWYWRTPTNRCGNESLKTRKRSQTSQTADHVVVNYLPVDRGHLLRTIIHEAAQC